MVPYKFKNESLQEIKKSKENMEDILLELENFLDKGLYLKFKKAFERLNSSLENFNKKEMNDSILLKLNTKKDKQIQNKI